MGAPKRLAEALLARGGPGRAGRLLHAGRTLVLAYHNVVGGLGDRGGDRSLHLTRAALADHLEALRRTHDVVPLAEALTPPARGGRPRVALTFDDAYAGAVRHGVELLAAASLPATIFVAPGRLGGQSFWWDAVGGPGGPGPSPAFRSHVLAALAGDDARARAAAAPFDLQPLAVPEEALTASERDLERALARHPGLTLAPHGWSHRNLAALDGGDLRRELDEPLAWLRERYDRVLDMVAYPYGLRSPAVDAAARAAGYRCGFRIEGGWLPRRAADPFALPRLNIPSGVSRDGFVARAAGLLR